MEGLFNILNKDFLYVTLVATDAGIEAYTDMKVPDNVFILSSGGLGNVPLNLFLRDFEPIEVKKTPKYTAVFFGTVENHEIRSEMARIASETLGDKFLKGSTSVEETIEIYKDAKAILCPRGNGRNSYRLTESLQMGLIPIVIYTDIP
ncbi:exostosin family protein [Histomonas meleagridis]|uniref:exostosin family protein n=1 Tax=Histomonas meleagridis TaxID=135588 RepID=UPI0035599905|nr:exostosin family protein [Histomonas meleagridis]KAH0798986.1 exostosin family protein [Histomonas meleagridis]